MPDRKDERTKESIAAKQSPTADRRHVERLLKAAAKVDASEYISLEDLSREQTQALLGK